MPKYVGNTAIPNEFSTLVTAVDTAKVDKAGDTMTGDLAMGDNSITGLADPVDDQDAATKAYVDTEVSGIVSDHGDLTGLTDDDHTQYHNDTRGDARYYTQTELDADQLTQYHNDTRGDARYYTQTELDADQLTQYHNDT